MAATLWIRVAVFVSGEPSLFIAASAWQTLDPNLLLNAGLDHLSLCARTLGPLSPRGLILRRWALGMWQALLHVVAALLAMGTELARSWCPCALCPRRAAPLKNC